MLKTLLEQAKPELLAALNTQMDEYPSIAESVVKHLEAFLRQLKFQLSKK